jgi:hypothetical protein
MARILIKPYYVLPITSSTLKITEPLLLLLVTEQASSNGQAHRATPPVPGGLLLPLGTVPVTLKQQGSWHPLIHFWGHFSQSQEFVVDL